jgi:hypothetical protein
MMSRTRSACAFVELAGKSKQDRLATYPQRMFPGPSLRCLAGNRKKPVKVRRVKAMA